MAEKYNFDKVVDRKSSDSTKWNRYGSREILPMWVADSDFEVAPEITAALHEAIDHRVYGYGKIPRKLIDLIVDRMDRFYDWKIKPHWIVWFPGVVGAMHTVCRGLVSAPNQIFYPSIIYPPFVSATLHSDAHPQSIPMTTVDQRLTIDTEWLKAAPCQEQDLLMLCNPMNPGGTMSSQSQLEKLGKLIVEKNWLVCSDEIHCDLILDTAKKHIPIAALNEDIARRSITLMAPSKTFNVAGLGCSFAIIPDKHIRRKVHKTSAGVLPKLNILGLQAAIAAYESGEEWNRQQCEYLRRNRDYLIQNINSINGLQIAPIDATYLAWMDISGLQLENPVKFFEDAGVGFSAGRDFGDERFMRINFGCTMAILKLAVERIRQAVQQRQ